jgi:predicted XRE-type DNA-binding protein
MALGNSKMERDLFKNIWDAIGDVSDEQAGMRLRSSLMIAFYIHLYRIRVN